MRDYNMPSGINTPVIVLQADTYDNVFKSVQILNKNSLEHYLYISIPPELKDNTRIYNIEDVTSKKYLDVRLFEHMCNRIWIRVVSDILDTSAGQHLYRMRLVNTLTNDTYSLYFVYRIQDDDPEKPYIYMDSKEDGTNC